MGRSKTFDQLVAELKTRVREKGSSSVDAASSAGLCQGASAAKEQSGGHYYRRPVTSLPTFRFSPSSLHVGQLRGFRNTAFVWEAVPSVAAQPIVRQGSLRSTLPPPNVEVSHTGRDQAPVCSVTYSVGSISH